MVAITRLLIAHVDEHGIIYIEADLQRQRLCIDSEIGRSRSGYRNPPPTEERDVLADRLLAVNHGYLIPAPRLEAF